MARVTKAGSRVAHRLVEKDTDASVIVPFDMWLTVGPRHVRSPICLMMSSAMYAERSNCEHIGIFVYESSAIEHAWGRLRFQRTYFPYLEAGGAASAAPA